MKQRKKNIENKNCAKVISRKANVFFYYHVISDLGKLIRFSVIYFLAC